ncbi:MAG: HAD-IC family P-type ATPase, partial [Anaerolineales bacterium]
MADWYKLSISKVLQELDTDKRRGLSEGQVAERLSKYGVNELAGQEGRSPWSILLEQLSGVMIIILFIAALISIFLGDYYDAVAIIAIIILNAALGFRQEYRAERSMAALKKLAVPMVRVRREGLVHEIPSAELVPGDIVLLETGNLVPADGRVLESVNLRVEEAALTGESVAIEKESDLVYEVDRTIGDRRNMVFM